MNGEEKSEKNCSWDTKKSFEIKNRCSEISKRGSSAGEIIIWDNKDVKGIIMP